MLIPLDEARAHVLERLPAALAPIELTVADAIGLVSAGPVLAVEAQPPFNNSAMDGYALRAGDVRRAPTELRVLGTTMAGPSTPYVVGEGQAVRIMTGAPLPEGADTVVPIEHIQVSDDGTAVRVLEPVSPGEHVRRAGEDVWAGDVVLAEGRTITIDHVGVLAGQGIEKVWVHRRPRVGVLSTGDELVGPGGALQQGQIRDSNRPALLAAVAASGGEAIDLGIAPDDAEELTQKLVQASFDCDAVVTSGGVSMGDLDLVKIVLDLIGDMRWMQIAIKPAKPFAFGLVHGVPVFGLPGNPVSSLVSFELFARPALRRLAGHPDERLDRPCPVAVAPEGLPRKRDGKVHFVRVNMTVAPNGGLEVRSAGVQGSHRLSSTAGANGLAVVPDGPGIEPGGTVDVLLVGEL